MFTLALRSEPGVRWTVNCAVQSQSGRSGGVIYLSSLSGIKQRLFSHPVCILVTLRKEFFFYKRTEIGIDLSLVTTHTTAMSANVANFVSRDFVETILRQDQYTFRELGYVV